MIQDMDGENRENGVELGVNNVPEDEYALTPEDIKNGWTLETKAAYIREREIQAAEVIYRDRKPAIVVENVAGYNAHDYARGGFDAHGWARK